MISIIIPNFNGKKLLEKYLPSLIDAVKFYNKECEIIVVDDASSDRSVEYLKENFKKVKIVSLKENRGFSSACNQGVKESNGEMLIFLNTDIKVEANFIEPLVKVIQNDSIFAVSPKIITPARGVNSGLIYAQFKRGFIRERHQILNDDDNTEPKPTLYVCGAAFACKKNKFFELDGFDEIYNPYFFEDFDICYRAWKRGWKNIYQPNSVVFHEEQQTIGKNKKKAKLIYDRNRLIFHWKNVTDLDLRIKHFFNLGVKIFLSIFLYKWNYLESFYEALKFINEISLRRQCLKKIAKFADVEILERFTK